MRLKNDAYNVFMAFLKDTLRKNLTIASFVERTMFNTILSHKIRSALRQELLYERNHTEPRESNLC